MIVPRCSDGKSLQRRFQRRVDRRTSTGSRVDHCGRDKRNTPPCRHTRLLSGSAGAVAWGQTAGTVSAGKFRTGCGRRPKQQPRMAPESIRSPPDGRRCSPPTERQLRCRADPRAAAERPWPSSATDALGSLGCCFGRRSTAGPEFSSGQPTSSAVNTTGGLAPATARQTPGQQRVCPTRRSIFFIAPRMITLDPYCAPINPALKPSSEGISIVLAEL